MQVLTVHTVEGQPVKQYMGLVTGEAIVGANIFRDVFAGVRNIVGGRSAAYEKELAKARTLATEEMSAAASEKGANTVIGVDLDYEYLDGMLMVTVSGTAVVL
ncbi:MAG: heavy metal-binding domain-containing protein [Gaiellaceae bacterium]